MHNGSLDYAQMCGKVNIYELLYVIALDDGEMKQAAVQGLQCLEATEEFLLHLTEIVLDSNFELDIRLLASAELKKHVETHWCSTAANFHPPEVDQRTKTKVKELLPFGLNISICKVREAVADVIATILPWDWPESWPNIFGELIEILYEESEWIVRTCLRVLCKLVPELKFYHFQSISMVILREMIRILKNEEYSEDIRCLAAEIFADVVTKAINYRRFDIVQDHLLSAISLFCESSLLSWTSPNNNKKLKTKILKTVVILVSTFPKWVAQFLRNMLPLVWATLMDCAGRHQANVSNAVENNAAVIADNDSDELVEAIFLFLKDLMRGSTSLSSSYSEFGLQQKEWFDLQDSFVPLHELQHVISFLEIAEKDVQLWETNINTFAGREAMPVLHDKGPRRATEAFLFVMPETEDRRITKGLFEEIMKHLQEEHEKRIRCPGTAVDQIHWKKHEAFLVAFCVLKKLVIAKKKAGSLSYDVSSLLENLVLADFCNPASHPLLAGRCLVAGGHYAGHMPSSLASAFLKATVNSLQENKPACVKVCAARAVFLWYYPNWREKVDQETRKILTSNALILLRGLCSLAENFTSEEVLVLTMQSIAFLVPFIRSFDGPMKTRIYSLIVKALLEYRKKYQLCRPWMTVVHKLALHSQCFESLQEYLAPTLLHMMTDPSDAFSDSTVALDILLILVRTSCSSRAPLTEDMIRTLLPALSNYIVRADDAKIFDVGIKIIDQYVLVILQQVINCAYGIEISEVQYIVDAIVRILICKSTIPRNNIAFRILTRLLKHTGCMHAVRVDQLISALSVCLHPKNGTCPGISFLRVWAYLINVRFETVFEFLMNTLNLPGQPSPLEYIVSEGFCREYYTFESKDRKVVKFALGKIFEHGVTNRISKLYYIDYKEDATLVLPLIIKIFKLTITESP